MKVFTGKTHGKVLSLIGQNLYTMGYGVSIFTYELKTVLKVNCFKLKHVERLCKGYICLLI